MGSADIAVTNCDASDTLKDEDLAASASGGAAGRGTHPEQENRDEARL